MSSAFDPELDEVVRASDRPTYNTAAVEQRTGLRPATFRAWERRYGFPKPRRLPGNQRLYSDQDIAAIRWLQRRTDEGLSISHAIRLLQDRLSETVAYVSPAEAPTGRGFGRRHVGDGLAQAVLEQPNGVADREPLVRAALEPANRGDVLVRVQSLIAGQPTRFREAIPTLPGAERGRPQPG